MSIVEWILIAFIALLFFGGASIPLFLWMRKIRWPIKVIILEDITGSGDYQPSRNDRARRVSFGDSGEEIYFLRKHKKYRAGYGKFVGRNYIAWAIGDDGYWYNIKFGNINKKLKEVGVIPVDRDLRMSMASMRKGIDNRYDTKTFAEKWAVPIALGMVILSILIQGGVTWFLLDKMSDVVSANSAGAETSLKVLELAEQVLGKVAIVQQGGSGLVPA